MGAGHGSHWGRLSRVRYRDVKTKVVTDELVTRSIWGRSVGRSALRVGRGGDCFASLAMTIPGSGSSGGAGTRTPIGFRPAVFKTAALPVRSTPPKVCAITRLRRRRGEDRIWRGLSQPWRGSAPPGRTADASLPSVARHDGGRWWPTRNPVAAGDRMDGGALRGRAAFARCPAAHHHPPIRLRRIGSWWATVSGRLLRTKPVVPTDVPSPRPSP